MANKVQGGKYRDLPPMRGIVRMLQSLVRGGEGGWDYVKFIVTAKICHPIRPSPMAPDKFTFRRKEGFVVANRV